ncbi:MAG TPA: hypothetical protein DEA99_07935 [Candidatus Omnitrophica bacterium]|nr:hypothetical protein [Candidatus Omnitrophota bacterium]
MSENVLPRKQNVILAYCLFIILNIVYLNVFAMNSQMWWEDENASTQFYFPLNLDQEKAYIPYMAMMEDGTYVNRISNSAGISHIYYALKKLTGFSYEDIPWVSFLINNLFIILCYRYFVKIGLQLGLEMRYRWLFFINPALIYYSQLINKEIFTLFFTLAFTYYLGRKQSLKVLLYACFAFIVRMQMLPVGILAIWLHRRRNYIWSLVIIYIITSLAGPVLLPQDIDMDTSSWMRADNTPGMVLLVQSLNQKYYIGSLILNPIKIVQYAFDQLRCIFFIMDDGRIDLYKFRDVLFTLTLAYLISPIMRLTTHFRTYINTPCRPLITVTCTFMLVLLVNPMVHSRYLFPISYNLVLLAVFVIQELKKTAKAKQECDSRIYTSLNGMQTTGV